VICNLVYVNDILLEAVLKHLVHLDALRRFLL